MSGLVMEVPPLSRRDIRAFAHSLRERCGLLEAKYVHVERVLEFGLPHLVEGFEWEVCEESELGGNHGMTFPAEKRILIRQDVYDGACDGHGRDRLTIAHEIGHLLLHEGIGMPRQVDRQNIPAYRDSEWQANCFAGEFLIMSTLVAPDSTSGVVAVEFGVSIEAAEKQLKHIRGR